MALDRIWYSCPDCGESFSRVHLLGDGKEETKCPHCGGIAHRDRLKELRDELNNRPGI